MAQQHEEPPGPLVPKKRSVGILAKLWNTRWEFVSFGFKKEKKKKNLKKKKVDISLKSGQYKYNDSRITSVIWHLSERWPIQ